MYSLLPIPLSISNGNGTRCVTSKSKPPQCIKQLRNETVLLVKSMITAYIIDLIALIPTLKDIPTTLEELIWKIVKTLPCGYSSIHIIADTYRETSIKSSEQEKFYKVNKYYGPPKSSRVSTKWLQQNKITRITVWISSVKQRWSATNFKIRWFGSL